MDFESYQGFDWDEGNRRKCQKHGVSAEDIERLFGAEPLVGPDLQHSEAEQRFRAVGVVSGRHIFAVFTLRDKDGYWLIRPISARYMHDKEVQSYERQRQT